MFQIWTVSVLSPLLCSRYGQSLYCHLFYVPDIDSLCIAISFITRHSPFKLTYVRKQKICCDYKTVPSGFSCDIMQHRFAVILDPYSWPLKMGTIFCPETSVRNYRYSLRNNPEGRSSHLLRGRSLKSRIGNYQCTLRNVAEEWWSRLHGSGSLKSRWVRLVLERRK